MDVRACVDVSDIERAVAFYRDGLGLSAGRRYRQSWVEMLGAPMPIDLLAEPEGSVPAANSRRSYQRHWTPVHFDFVVTDLEAAVARAVKAGATVDREIQKRPYGRIAVLADPFGNGFCLLEMQGRGYDALIDP